MIGLAEIRTLGRNSVPTVVAGTTKWRPVSACRDLARVLAIPRRDVDVERFDAIRAAVTRPGAKLRLWDVQCAALGEALDADGLFASMPVGSGKTLVGALLPTIVQRRAVYLTTPKLAAQVESMLADYRREFHIRDDLVVESYSALSSQRRARLLEDHEPGLIVADECQALSARGAARTKRFLRYMRRRPGTRFCALSGTVTRKSIKDFAHLLQLALREQTPLPLHWPSLAEWAEALDVDAERPAGALRIFCTGAETPRQGWQRRLRDTQGVVVSEVESCSAQLVLRDVPEYEPPEIVAKAIADLHRTWERPDGELLILATDVSRVARQLRLGGHHRWAWPDHVTLDEIREWTDARREYLREIAAVLKTRSREGMDSPGLVEDAATRGEIVLRSRGAWHAAKARIPAPLTWWVWLTDGVARRVAEIAEDIAPCIIWTDTPVFGQQVANLCGATYYGEGREAANDILLERGDQTIVASIQAHGTGRNLQSFSRALVAGGGSSGATWEQLLGRLHRAGQLADRVEYALMFPADAEKAREDAKYIQEITGSPQKLLTAQGSGIGARAREET